MFIKPFNALLYNPKKVKIEDAICPPYDTIDEKLQEILYERSPYNVVKLTFGKILQNDTNENNRYTRSAWYLEEFIKDNALVKDNTPSFYLDEITFTDPLTAEHKKIDLIFAILDLENSKPYIFPHENVLEQPIIDRMNLLHSTNANFGSVFLLYEDKEFTLEEKILNKMKMGQAIFEFPDTDNTYHKLYRISNTDDTQFIANFLQKRDGFIADGHHRYFAALKYYEFAKEKGLNPDRIKYRMVALSNARNKNLLILPTHRVVFKNGVFRNLDEFYSLLVKYFEITEITDGIDYDTIKKHILSMNKHNLVSFLIYLKQHKKLFKIRSRVLTDYTKIISINASNKLKNIDTTVLHYLVLPALYDMHMDKLKVPDEIYFTRSLGEAITYCKNEKICSVIFLSPIKVDDLIFIAKLGERFPPKTTYFYPKIPSGLTIYKF